MEGRQDVRSKLQRVHDAYLRHKKTLAYWDVALIAVALVVGTRYGAVARALLAPAVLTLVLMVIETLVRLETTVGDRLARLEASLTRFLHPEEFTTGPAAESAILELVRASKARPTTIDVISATGGSNLPFLRDLERLAETKDMKLNLHLVDPHVPSPAPLPDHWESEIEATLKSIRGEFAESSLHVTVYQYSHLPSLRAILVDHEHLLLGFFRWTKSPKARAARFGGAEGAHRLYRKSDPGTLYYVNVVEDWLAHAPKREVVSVPVDA